ncbi:hypothetical protein CVV65_06555 [Kyrpidia spormannii]|uniref:histidine kinase n=2 Tax=Kyrpidia spormannii TaxID=2055160 RepID=A0A2K8N771_9BACL|nr:hypothetical protein CVV65_06555 [Kyrpidia spormannii]
MKMSDRKEQGDNPALYCHALLEHASDGLVVADEERRIVFMNRAARELVGLAETEQFPDTCAELLQCRNDKDENLALAPLCFGHCVLNTKAPLSYVEMNIHSRQGDVIPVAVSYSYIPAGNRRYFLMSLRDLRERRHLEEERRKRDEMYFTLQERERLARDLHDGVVQDIAYSHMQLKLVQSLLAQGRVAEAQDKLRDVTEVVHDSFVELRHVLYDLTIHAGKDLKHFLSKWLAEFQQRSGIPVEVAMLEFPDTCDPYIGDQVTKIVQEALANVRKHSGATKAWMTLGACPVGPYRQQFSVIIEDNGCGIPEDVLHRFNQGWADHENAGRHFGLKAMRERAQSLGGILTISRRNPTGTRVELHWFQDISHEDAVKQAG